MNRAWTILNGNLKLQPRRRGGDENFVEAGAEGGGMKTLRREGQKMGR